MSDRLLDQLITKTSPECLSDYALDGLLSSGSSPEQSAHLEGCERCRRLREDRRAAFESAQLPALQPMKAERPNVMLWGLAAGALAASALLLVRSISVRDPDEVTIRGSGAAKVSILTKEGTQAMMLPSGAKVHPGQALRFSMELSKDGYGAVLGRDSLGGLWVGGPTTTSGMQKLPAGRATVLDGAVELDAAGSQETLVFFSCQEDHPIAELLERSKAEFPPTLVGCETTTRVVDKEGSK